MSVLYTTMPNGRHVENAQTEEPLVYFKRKGQGEAEEAKEGLLRNSKAREEEKNVGLGVTLPSAFLLTYTPHLAIDRRKEMEVSGLTFSARTVL